MFFVYDEKTKREPKRILIYECRCNERLKAEVEGYIRLGYTGLIGGLEHLKIETRLRDRDVIRTARVVTRVVVT
jgi:hypothetical protein